MAAEQVSVRCCVVGGGPAGMMLGLLLARAGVEVLVLEKHADFLRDFRGDTIHPSTLELMHELGVLDDFLRRPHQELETLTAQVGDIPVPVADFSRLPTRCRFIAFMPQWDFLAFVGEQAARHPKFRLRMQAEAIGLVARSGRIAGVQAVTPEGRLEVLADLVVAADGRHSTARREAGLKVDELGAPMDVLWFRLSRRNGDPEDALGRVGPGHILITINRGDYWQCGFVIPKGSLEPLRQGGLQAFRDGVAKIAPFAGNRMAELGDWDDIKLLTVRVDRLPLWHRPGLLCIGDAAHAMSPIGGVGINLAIQDAVAAANILAAPLREGRLSEDHLRLVQRRRELPVRLTQRLQLVIQDKFVTRVLAGGTDGLSPPLALRLMARLPMLRRLAARLIGMGIRPEHVKAAPEEVAADSAPDVS